MGKMFLGKERIGSLNINKFGSQMEVYEYNNCDDVWIKFLENGNLVHTDYSAFLSGSVKNPYDRTIFGIGYLGEGKYKASKNSKNTDKYSMWKDILKRCYSENYHKKQPTYKECSVVEEWHNFQNFAAWYDKNYYEIDGQRMQLDKDILVKGNKIYSPNTCIIVPQKINNLFRKSGNSNANKKLIKQTAEEYKDRIPLKLYNTMINYLIVI